MLARRRGFSLLELLVLVAIIAMLAAVLFPVFERARDVATQSTCISNLQQLAQAVLMYANDWDGCAPGVAIPWAYGNAPDWPRNEYVAWQVMIEPYVSSREIYSCPSNPDWCVVGSHIREFGTFNPSGTCMFWVPVPSSWAGVSVGYAMTPLLQLSVDVGDTSCSWFNWDGLVSGEIDPRAGFGGRNLSRLTDPARVIMISDSNSTLENCPERADFPDICGIDFPICDESFSAATPAHARHNGGNNWIYVDGHAEWVRCGQYDCSSGNYMATDEEILSGNTMQKVHGVDQLN